jgi:hypothetical protein
MIGLAGGFLFVPILILIFQLPAQNAIAVSLVAITGTTISATLGYIRQKKVNFKLGLLYDILDIPGVVLGAYLTTLLPSNILTVICGVFLVIISLLLTKRSIFFWNNKQSEKVRQKEFHYSKRSIPAILTSSLLGGFITGLSGLGGGITDTSTMILLGVPSHIAVASSEFAMALTNSVGVIAHGVLNNILLDYAFPLTIGTIIGAQMGCLLCKRVKASFIKKVIALITFVVGLRLIFSLFVI